jgi:hypothetical protein
VPERAFPVIYAEDVERSVRFYASLGFEEHFRLPSDGEPGYVSRGCRCCESPRTCSGGERVAWVVDPDGNPVAFAAGAGQG